MANIVNNLRVNNSEVKTIWFNNVKVKEFYYNDELIWKNANPFVFTTDVSTVPLSDYGQDTLIFEGFSPDDFIGSYSIVENAEQEKSTLIEGQMVVEEPTTEGEE